MPTNRKILILLLLILAIAIFFRFWNLAQIPPGLYPDVAINGNDALHALQTGQFKVFYPENNGREGLFINLIALSFWLFGASILAIKVVPAVIGVLTVLGLYLLIRELFGYLKNSKTQAPNSKQISNSNDQNSKQFGILNLKNCNLFGIWNLEFGISCSEIIALLSSFFLAISFWHVNFSRLGFRAIMVPFCLVWSFYFLFRGLNAEQKNGLNKKIGNWILAGIFFCLGFYTYIAFRIAPLILLPILFFEILNYWPRLKSLIANRKSLSDLLKKIYIVDHWWRWDVFFAVIILVALPLAIYFVQHPQDFMGRTGQVSVLATANPLKTLAVNTVKTLGIFNIAGDCNWRHNDVYPGGNLLSFGACQPELLWPVGLLFLVGFFFALIEAFRPANWRQKQWPALAACWTLLFWFGAMLLPEVLTNEGVPHALRSIGVIPAVFIFAGLGAFLVFKIVKKWFRKTGAKLDLLYLLIFFLLAALAWREFNKYFLDWGQRPEVKDEFTQRYVDEANYLNSLPASIHKYVLVNERGVPVPYPNGIPMPAQTIIFLTQGKSEIKYLVPASGSSFSPKTPAVILPMRYEQEIFDELKIIYPNGRAEKINDFAVFKINPAPFTRPAERGE